MTPYLLLLSIILTLQVTPTLSILVQISRKIRKSAALDILPFFLENEQLYKLSNHGCWCSKILNNLGNDQEGTRRSSKNVADELDGICKQWHMAANCLHSVGGACNNYRRNVKS